MKANTMRNNGITFSLDTIFFLSGGRRGRKGCNNDFHNSILIYRGSKLTLQEVFLKTSRPSLLTELQIT